MRCLPAVSLLALTLSMTLLAACASYGASDREMTIPGYTAGDIWLEVLNFARTRRFRRDPIESDDGRRIFTSKWRTVAVAFRRGSRKRFRASVVPADSGWMVRYHVEVQRITSTHKAMRPEDDDWAYSGQDQTSEQEFVQVMRIAFRLDESAGDQREGKELVPGPGTGRGSGR